MWSFYLFEILIEYLDIDSEAHRRYKSPTKKQSQKLSLKLVIRFDWNQQQISWLSTRKLWKFDSFSCSKDEEQRREMR